MNKTSKYIMTLATAGSLLTACEHKNIQSQQTTNALDELILVSLEVKPAIYATDKGSTILPVNDSILEIFNVNSKFKIIYENEANSLAHSSSIAVDKITSYNTSGPNNAVIKQSSYQYLVRGAEPIELTDTLFISADEDWKNKVNLFKDVKRKEEQREQDRQKAKQESEYNSLRTKIYNTITEMKK
jgi:hypothetical protein